MESDPHATGSRAAIKAAILAVWDSSEFDRVDDDEGAGMVADAVIVAVREAIQNTAADPDVSDYWQNRYLDALLEKVFGA